VAANKALEGPKPVAYYEHYWHRLEWEKASREEVPYPGSEYWIIRYRGEHVGEFFEGKSKVWFGVLFGSFVVRSTVRSHVLHTLTGCIVGPQH
jgi:hypothetical protein